jgi:Domain of unknown function (DUF4178)
VATTPQRAYRAACPNCGAAVEFRSAASASAVCSFCRSTLVRDGEALRRIGTSAELFDDHSPLQLGASGRYQGSAFTLVGRLQVGYADGTWNEWHALFDSGKSGWLSEDNGAYVVAFDTPLTGEAPRADELSAGERRLVHGSAWSVASVTRARLIAAQGELVHAPRQDGAEFTVADLRNERGEVGTLDYSDPAGAVGWTIGRAVRLAELNLAGLREAGEKTLGSRAFECPNCGTSLELKLATTESIACHQCKSVIDVSAGIGADLAHFAQANSGHDGAEPQIPLGSVGRLELDGRETDWQVVGYQERCDIPIDDDDEQTFWREYLLFNRTEGFVFLVDSEDGWSWARPLTGVPQLRGDTAAWQGKVYDQRDTYDAKVTWVLGEFYWRVRRDERAVVTDFHGMRSASNRRLSREQTGDEVTWSEGATLKSEQLARAFGVAVGADSALRREGASGPPLSIDGGLAKALLIVAVVGVVLAAGFCTSRDSDCAEVRAAFGDASNEYRQCLRGARSGSGFRSGGGSFGGYSSGGGHK